MALSSIDFYYFFLYTLVCLLSLFAGIGLYSMFGNKNTDKKNLFVFPFLTLLLITFLLNISVYFKIPVKLSWPVFDVLVLSLAVFGFIKETKEKYIFNKWLIVGWIALPLLIMAGPYWYGSATKFGDVLPDGWNYISIGQYIWQFPLGAHDGLSPFYQYTSAFSQARFTSSAFLALFSSLFAKQDVAASSGVYLGWIVFVLVGADSFFISNRQLSGPKKILYVTSMILSGWIFNILWAANYDNLLCLAYIPILFELINNPEYTSWGWAVFIGMSLSALLLTYLELSGFIFLILFLILTIRLIFKKYTDRKKYLLFIVVLGSVFVLLLVPFSKWILSFFLTQINTIKGQGIKPGSGLFTGLLELRCFPSAFWAFGCEHSNGPGFLYTGGSLIIDKFLTLKNFFATLMTFISLSGVIFLVKNKQLGEFSFIFVIFISAVYMALVQKYAYGTYKLITLIWWLVPYISICGIEMFINWGKTNKLFNPSFYYISMLILISISLFRSIYVATNKPAFTRVAYAQVQNSVGFYDPLLIHVDNWLSSSWAAYYTRDDHIYFSELRMYMASYSAAITQPKPGELSDIHSVLIDNGKRYHSTIKEVWKSQPYSIWSLSPNWILPGDIQSQYGKEISPNKISFWLGNKKAAVYYISSFDGMADLLIDANPGPGLPQNESGIIKISDENNFSNTISITKEDHYSIQIPVKKGGGKFFIQALNTKSIPNANGDPRILYVFIQNIDFAPVIAP